MNLTDGLDLVAELLPRKARHAVGIGVVVVALCCPSGLSRFVTWYAAQKSHRIVQEIQHAIPDTAPPVAGVPGPATRVDRRLDHAGN